MHDDWAVRLGENRLDHNSQTFGVYAGSEKGCSHFWCYFNFDALVACIIIKRTGVVPTVYE